MAFEVLKITAGLWFWAAVLASPLAAVILLWIGAKWIASKRLVQPKSRWEHHGELWIEDFGAKALPNEKVKNT